MARKREKWGIKCLVLLRMTWLAKYSEWVSWKVPVAGATYTSLILLLYNVHSTVYSYGRTSVLYLLRTYLYWYTYSYRCTLYFYGRTSTCARTHIRLMYWKFHSPYPTHVRHYDYYICRLCTRTLYNTILM